MNERFELQSCRCLVLVPLLQFLLQLLEAEQSLQRHRPLRQVRQARLRQVELPLPISPTIHQLSVPGRQNRTYLYRSFFSFFSLFPCSLPLLGRLDCWYGFAHTVSKVVLMLKKSKSAVDFETRFQNSYFPTVTLPPFPSFKSGKVFTSSISPVLKHVKHRNVLSSHSTVQHHPHNSSPCIDSHQPSTPSIRNSIFSRRRSHRTVNPFPTYLHKRADDQSRSSIKYSTYHLCLYSPTKSYLGIALCE